MSMRTILLASRRLSRALRRATAGLVAWHNGAGRLRTVLTRTLRWHGRLCRAFLILSSAQRLCFSNMYRVPRMGHESLLPALTAYAPTTTPLLPTYRTRAASRRLRHHTWDVTAEPAKLHTFSRLKRAATLTSEETKPASSTTTWRTRRLRWWPLYHASTATFSQNRGITADAWLRHKRFACAPRAAAGAASRARATFATTTATCLPCSATQHCARHHASSPTPPHALPATPRTHTLLHFLAHAAPRLARGLSLADWWPLLNTGRCSSRLGAGS